MQKIQFVEQIVESTVVNSYFLVKRAELRSKRGEQFAHLTLVDKTGVIEGKFYGEKAVDVPRSIQVGRVYKISGEGRVSQIGERYIFSDSAEAIKDIFAGPVKLTPSHEYAFVYTPAKLEENAFEIQKIVGSIRNTDLKLFVTCCLDARFYECPAAIRRHHEYTGGLCEHSLETVRIALSLIDTISRSDINRDMVIAGSVLHDIGKIFCFDKVGYGYVPNDTYNLIEHITMGIMYIDEYKHILSDAQLLQLRHIIQSHHGSYGDVIPLTIEAWLVHKADSDSSLLRSIIDDLAETPTGQKKKGLRSEKFLWHAV
ncbi:MAG TPA: HD domain-containing protein [Methanocorpusculum sp.]|nr:HD domain-containing protein [Methanocorpusculum sp.]HJJ53575.1 HD domain-containing protein [Methanocorpusculum sp.]